MANRPTVPAVSALHAALMLALASSAAAPALALAQQTPPPAGQAQDGDKDDTTKGQLDTIVVTGSRISRAGFDTLEPAQVVTRESIQQIGATNVAEALFRQPSFGAGASYKGGQSSFGAGVNFISHFGLGSNRELTLVNGRRFVSSNPPTVFGPFGAHPGRERQVPHARGLRRIPGADLRR